MPEICENWLGLVNICVYYARPTREIYQALYYVVNLKAPVSFEIHWVKQYLVNVVLFGIKDLQTSKLTVKLKSNLYGEHVNISHNFWRCL